MDKDERRKMLENKKAFIAALSIALREHDARRTNVKNIRLEIFPSLVPGSEEEQIRIDFLSGGSVTIPATGNSNLANMIAIGRTLL